MGHQNSNEEINIKELLIPYLKRWYWFIITSMIALLLGLLYLKNQQKVFSVESTVLIKDAKSKVDGDFAMLQDLSGLGGLSSDGVENEIEIFKSKKLMRQVVKNLHLQADIFVEEQFKNKELYGEEQPFNIQVVNMKNTLEDNIPFNLTVSDNAIQVVCGDKKISSTFNKLIQLPLADIIITRNKKFNKKEKHTQFIVSVKSLYDRVNQYQEIANVNLANKGTTVLKLSMNYPVVQKSKDILNELVNAYNRDAIADKNFSNTKTAEFIDDRIVQIGQDLGEVEGEKQQYKQRNNITDIPTEAELNLRANADAYKKQIELESQLDLTNTMLNYAKKQSVNQTLPANVGLDNPGAIQSITMYNELVLERNRLLQGATEEHPSVIDITKRIRKIRPSILQNLEKHKTGLELAKSNYQNQRSKINNRISKIPTQEKIFRSLERKQQIKENLYLLLLKKREENQIAMAIIGQKARVIDGAYKGKKVAPKSLIILMSSLIIGFLIPIALIYIQQLFNTKLKSKHDLEKLLGGKTILGEIPSLNKGEPEVIGRNDLTPMAEAFRIMITNLKFTLPMKLKGNTIYITSTVKGEGKTFIAANTALALTSSKKKTIIIGADIRNPQLQRFNNTGKGLLGLSEYLHDGEIKIGQVIHQSSVNENLDVIYSGSIPPNPTDLLSGSTFKVLLNKLKEEYDYVLVDTAPLMLVTDTFLISEYADATIYVTRSGYTEKQLIDFANNQVDNKKINNVGFVINDVKKDYFGYGNKYGYGYGAEERTVLQRLIDKLKFRS